jgi:xylan 1,4-beta-xylosidase
MDYRFLRVCRDDPAGAKLLTLTSLVNGERTEFPCYTLPEGRRVYLRLTFAGRELRFFYSLDARAERSLDAADWTPVGAVLDTSELSDEFCTAGEFTGTFVGIACVDSSSRSVSADFDWFEYRPTFQAEAHSAMPLRTGPSALPFSVSE